MQTVVKESETFAFTGKSGTGNIFYGNLFGVMFMNVDHHQSQAFVSFVKQEIDVADDFEQVANEKVYQLMAGSSLAEHPALMKDVSHARITFWWNRAVDIIPTDGGKGRGIEKMLEYYHFDKSQAMAFGDGNNDIEMLKSVGHGVAMANASDELKAIADDVCGDVAEDGIYYYCLEHGMI